MEDPNDPAAAALARLHKVTRLYYGLAVLGLAMTWGLFLAVPSMGTGIVLLVSLVNLQAAHMGRQYAKRASSREM